MIRLLAISGLIAGAALIMFAERLGLPLVLAEHALLILAGIALIAVALTSVTSHLAPFLAGEMSPGLVRIAALQALHLLGAIMLAGKGSLPPANTTALIVGAYLVGLAVTPSMEREERSGALAVPALRRDEAPLILGAIGVLSGLALAVLLPALPAWIGPSIAQFVNDPMRLPALLGVALIFGGMLGLHRLAGSLIALALLFVGVPFAIELAREIPTMAVLRGEIPTFVTAGISLIGSGREMSLHAALGSLSRPEMVLALVLGISSGLIASPLGMGLPARLPRFMAGILSVVLAMGVVGIVPAALASLEASVMREFVGQQPARWPFFAFDEAIRSWIIVCGQVPSDVEDVLAACRTANTSMPLPRDALEITRDMQLPAIATSRGMPVVMGSMWLLIAGFAALLGLAALLHRTATTISEVILFGLLWRTALRSDRLLAARLTIIAILVAYWHSGVKLQPEDAFARFMLIASLLLLACTCAGIIVRRLVVMFNRWRQRRREARPTEPEAPAPELLLTEQAA